MMIFVWAKRMRISCVDAPRQACCLAAVTAEWRNINLDRSLQPSKVICSLLGNEFDFSMDLSSPSMPGLWMKAAFDTLIARFA